MSRRRKLEKFADLLSFPNVFETCGLDSDELRIGSFETLVLAGKWNEKVFKKISPITLELACGRGEYTLALAKKYPQKHVIGMDIKGARIWKGARSALDLGLKNVAFLRAKIERIATYFCENEISGIWITFPDPFPSKENRRMTSPRFLDEYAKILKRGGGIHLKTDDEDLYRYTVDTVKKSPAYHIVYQSDNIYNAPLYNPDLEFKTHYELIHLENEKTIKYLFFVLND